MSSVQIPQTLEPTFVLGSVYYIHPSNSSNTKLVNELFSGNNYGHWKCSIMLVLSSINKLYFIDGSLEEPDSSDSKYKAWNRCNDHIIVG